MKRVIAESDEMGLTRKGHQILLRDFGEYGISGEWMENIGKHILIEADAAVQ
jgi:hypothetical protein